MAYALPLSDRRRHSENRRWRYRIDPEYRLAIINRERAKRGAPTMAEPPANELAPMPCPWPRERRASNPEAKLRPRDDNGRFVAK